MLCKHITVTEVQATGIPGPKLVGGSEESVGSGESVVGRFLAVEMELLDF